MDKRNRRVWQVVRDRMALSAHVQSLLAEQSAAPKSELYLSFLPLVTAKRVELPDNRKALTQLAQLERRSRPGGREMVDHPPGGGSHDDLANVIAGGCVLAAQPVSAGTIYARNLGPASRIGIDLTSPSPRVIATYETEYLLARAPRPRRLLD